MLDNGSKTSLFSKKLLVQNIYDVEMPLELLTNGGEINLQQKAIVNGFGDIWFHPNSISNIFSFSELKDKYRITYDYRIVDSFNIHIKDKIVKFKGRLDGLYLFKPPPQAIQEVNMIETVKEKELLFTPLQISRAKQAQKLYHNLDTPSIKDFKAIIRVNAIENNLVTIDDINIAEKVFGKDISSLKGKTTRTRPTPVINDYIKIPRKLTK